MSIRKQSKLITHIVDDHNNALNFILRGIGSKRLCFHDNLLIHFDSHPDLLLSEDLCEEDIFNKETLLEKVSIETWILPMVYARHINEIIWIKPLWSNQIDIGTYIFFIGETAEKEIKVSEPLLYFISSINYAPFEELLNPKKVTLHVITLNSELNAKSNTLKCDIFKLIEKHDGQFLLDIDLDYFYTLNPFIDLHNEANMYEYLKQIYSFPEEEIYQSSAKRACTKRKNQLFELNSVFKRVEEEFANSQDIAQNIDCILSNLNNKEIYSPLKDLLLGLNKIEKVDWSIVHDAGTTVDDTERILPHHPSSDHEIESYIQEFKDFVSKLPTPKMITIARSSSDDYCPEHIADKLEDRLCSILRNSFDTSINFSYKENQ